MAIDRRHLLGASVLSAGIGASVVGVGMGISEKNEAAPAPLPDTSGLNGSAIEPFHGEHQAGVETLPQAHGHFLSLSLDEGTKAADVVRMMRLLSDDAAALTQGEGPLADSEPELSERPARLTVTFGFGQGLVDLAGKKHRPAWLAPLPSFTIDELDEGRCAGDLLLQVCGDDPMTISHAVRMLLKDAHGFGRVAWSQESYRRAYGSDPAGTTIRNPFGQIDGTANPGPGSEDFARLVWGTTLGRENPAFSARGEPPTDLAADYPTWLQGGTSLVVRDIEMDLATWDEADRPAREFSVGRRMSNGAPTTGTHEHDVPDFEATDASGLSVISPASHMARSRNEDSPEQQIFRRVYGYTRAGSQAAGDKVPSLGNVTTAGLMFASYQANPTRQFLPIQKRLDQMDLLNQWTTPVGSTVWAIPPGIEPGSYVGDTLFEG